MHKVRFSLPPAACYVLVLLSVVLCVLARPAALSSGATVDLGDGLRVAKIGLGCMEVVSPCTSGRGNESTPCDAALSPEKTRELVTGAIAAGMSHFDTAEEYKAPPGPNDTIANGEDLIFGGKLYGEEQLGAALKGLPRDSFSVGTKYSHGRRNYLRGDGAEIERGVDAARARLGLDYIDLYYLHRPLWGLHDIDELTTAMFALKRAVAQGKIGHVGLSEVDARWLRHAHAIHPIAAVQMEWSLLSRGIERDIVPTCVELGIGIVAYSPLARLFLGLREDEVARALTQPQTVVSPMMGVVQPRYQFGDTFAANLALVRAVAQLARRKGVTTAQLSLAWLYHRADELGVKLVAIPGTSHLSHARENAAALQVRLNASEMRTLEALGANVRGPRGGKEYMSITYETNTPPSAPARR